MSDLEITYVKDEDEPVAAPVAEAPLTTSAGPDYEIVSDDPTTPVASSLMKKKLRELKRYRKAVNRMAELEKSRPNRIKRSRRLRARQQASRRANW